MHVPATGVSDAAADPRSWPFLSLTVSHKDRETLVIFRQAEGARGGRKLLFSSMAAAKPLVTATSGPCPSSWNSGMKPPPLDSKHY